MKPTALFLLCFFTFAAQAQNKGNYINKNINDNGKTLSIKVYAIMDDKVIDYENSFDVDGWSKWQRDSLVRRITDSLGVPTNAE